MKGPVLVLATFIVAVNCAEAFGFWPSSFKRRPRLGDACIDASTCPPGTVCRAANAGDQPRCVFVAETQRCDCELCECVEGSRCIGRVCVPEEIEDVCGI